MPQKFLIVLFFCATIPLSHSISLELLINNSNGDCGQARYNSPYIIGGANSIKGQWPWLTSLFYTATEKFFCGASLITEQHLLSTAHCFPALPVPSDYYALLGRFNLGDDSETDWIRSSISIIVRHEEYGSTNQSADADISILKMSKPVKFTEFIQAICLPYLFMELDDVTGVVAGYGKSEALSDHEMTPKHVELRAVDLLTCFYNDRAYVQIASRRNFCAGGEGSSPCRGDSGGGFFVQTDLNRWTIYGIVSEGIIDGTSCDANRYVVFVDVVKFMPWIQNALKVKIENPCDPTPCGGNETCIASYDSYVCVCDEGFGRVDLSSSCESVASTESPNPCYRTQSPCGPFSSCGINKENEVVCFCLPGYFGSPPNCRIFECEENLHCNATENCLENKCVDLCVAQPCGLNAQCEVVNHEKNCTCILGFDDGDPQIECRKVKRLG